MSWQQHLMSALLTPPLYGLCDLQPLRNLAALLTSARLVFLAPFSSHRHSNWAHSFIPITLTAPSVLFTSKSLSLAQVSLLISGFNICTWKFHRRLSRPNRKSQPPSCCPDLSLGLIKLETLALFLFPASFSGLNPVNSKIPLIRASTYVLKHSLTPVSQDYCFLLGTHLLQPAVLTLIQALFCDHSDLFKLELSVGPFVLVLSSCRRKPLENFFPTFIPL